MMKTVTVQVEGKGVQLPFRAIAVVMGLPVLKGTGRKAEIDETYSWPVSKCCNDVTVSSGQLRL